MRILHIITRMDPGGSAESTARTACHFARRGHEVHLMTGPSERWDILRGMLDQAGVRVVVETSLRRGIGIMTDLRALARVRAYTRKHRFDLVHTHSSKGGVIGRWAAWLSRRDGLPKIVHTPHGHVFYGYFGRMKTHLYLEIERRTARITDALVALTETGVEEYRAFRVIPRGKILAVPSGIDFDEIGVPTEEEKRGLRARFGLGDRPVVGTVARLEPIKGVETLIRAVSMISRTEAHTLVVGDGALRGELESLARGLGVGDRVHFVGWQRPIEGAISCMDVFVQPSINEGMGRTLVTAIYLGKVCVATRVGGIPSLMKFAEPRFLVPPRDPGALAAAIDAAFKSAEGDRREAGARQQDIQREYSTEVMIGGLERLYGELLG